MDNQLSALRLLRLLCLLAGIWCTYVLVSGIMTLKSTVLVDIHTSNASFVSVTQPGRSASLIGQGNSKVRLKPGDYEFVAINGQKFDSKIVTVDKDHKSLLLAPNESHHIPSENDIDFQGFDTLIDHGFTDDQVTALKNYFFRFKTTSKTVSIDDNSLVRAPHNPDVDTFFTTLFAVKVDGHNLKGAMSYSGFTDLSLKLTDEAGNQVFDSAALAQPQPGNG